MYEVSTGSTAIGFGAHLKIGYRLLGSANPFVYLNYHPSYTELPYTFSLPSAGEWEIQYAVVCSSCSGNDYSSVETTIVTVN